MTTEDSLVQVQRLLGLLPGVEVVWVWQCSDLIRLGMAIRSPETLACLAWLTFGSNLLLVVEIAHSPRRHGAACDPEQLRYDLRIPKNLGHTEPPDPLQLLGIYLARELKARHLLDPEEADRLQEAWNAIPL